MHFLIVSDKSPQSLVFILHQYTNQMAYIHLIYTIFSSQTILIQKYKLIHVNFLLPKTYSSLFSSLLPPVGSPCGPLSICPDSSSSDLFHPSPGSIALCSEAAKPQWVARRVQAWNLLFCRAFPCLAVAAKKIVC